MKLNRFSMLCAVALALTATSVFAQDTKPTDPAQGTKPAKGQRKGGGMNAKSLEKALDLTPEQLTKLVTVLAWLFLTT